MYKEVLRSIDSIEIFPVISFVIFFSFFTFLLFRVWRYDRSLMGKMAALPVDLNENEPPVSTTIQDPEKPTGL